MAIIARRPDHDTKGLIVLTHKERATFGAPVMRSALEMMRDEYVILMHWGHHHSDVDDPWYVDAHLAGPTTISFRTEGARHIPLCSRDFIDPMFTDEPEEPMIWDVLCIARPSKVKRMTDLLGAARAVFDQGHRVKVLMLCARPRDISDGDVWDHEFLNAWQEGFTASEKDDLELVLPVDDGTMFPYGALDIARLYRASRSFLLCSQREGESRVIHEALLSGTPVLARRDLIGGGLDHLDEANSQLYETVEELASLMIGIKHQDPPVRVDVSEMRRRFGIEASGERFNQAMRDLHRELGLNDPVPFDVTGFANLLPGHAQQLPPHVRTGKTDDLFTLRGGLWFIEHALGRRVPGRRRVRGAHRMRWLQKVPGRCSMWAYRMKQRWTSPSPPAVSGVVLQIDRRLAGGFDDALGEE